MSDKSPRKNMSKKSEKSIKEKRAEKRAASADKPFGDRLTGKKR